MLNTLIAIILYLIFIFISGSMLKLQMNKIIEVINLKRKGILTTGIVKEIEQVLYEEPDADLFKYHLTVAFTTTTGEMYEEQAIKDKEEYYHVGLEVHVLYLDDNPKVFLVNDPDASVLLGSSLLIFLFPFLFLCNVSLFILLESLNII